MISFMDGVDARLQWMGENFEKKWIIEGIAAVYEALYLATYTEFQWGFKGVSPLYFIWVSPLPLEN